MKKITRKKHLEMRLQSIPSHPKPKVNLEQYTTPSIIASDLVWNAFSLGDIDGKNIFDLGCGTGIFTIASALMGANLAVGIDIDEDSIDLANEVSHNLNVDNAEFIQSDICDFNCEFNVDTIFQNPPFGSQRKADSGQDLKFVKKSIELEKEFNTEVGIDELFSYAYETESFEQSLFTESLVKTAFEKLDEIDALIDT